MALRPCLDCGTLTSKTRCPKCERPLLNARYAARGTTAQRGLAGDHARISRMYKEQNLPCVRCGNLGTPANPITAGHKTRRADGGTSDPSNYEPQCRSCNSQLNHTT
jgi:hypothetical protein